MAETWIEFVDAGTSPSGKTRRWNVRTRDGGHLGGVSWYAPWRRYAFNPAPSTVYEQDCMRTIADFCETQTRDHKAPRP